MERLQLEETFKVAKLQPLCHGQCCPPAADQAAWDSIQPGFDFLQGWGTYSFSGQEMSLPQQPLSKKKLANI